MSGSRRVLLVAAAPVLLVAGACRAGAWSAPGSGPPDAREIRLIRDLSLTGITWHVEIREPRRGGPATGSMRVTTGEVNRRGVEREFGCRARADGPVRGSWTCAVPFRRGAPDWTVTLARLDALGIMSPPQDSTLSGNGAARLVPLCLDGTPWALQVRAQGGAAGILERQSCGPVGLRRAAFEAGIDTVFDEIVAAARAR